MKKALVVIALFALMMMVAAPVFAQCCHHGCYDCHHGCWHGCWDGCYHGCWHGCYDYCHHGCYHGCYHWGHDKYAPENIPAPPPTPRTGSGLFYPMVLGGMMLATGCGLALKKK